MHEGDKKHYAIKIANKKKLKKKMLSRTTSVYTLLEKEVATMKKLVFILFFSSEPFFRAILI